MPDTRVSVVIPAKDDAPALERCLAALAEQTVRPWEIVVVDNGSTDDTADVARRAGARVVPEPRPGIPAATTTGYDSADGELILRCDADTVPGPGWVEHAVAAFEADPDLLALTGTGTFYDVPRWYGAVVGGLYLGSYRWTMHAALAHPPLWGSTAAFRRETWLAVRDAVHREDPELHDDVDLSFALGPTGRIVHDDAWRVRVSGRSLRGAGQMRRRFRRAFRTLRVGWAGLPPWERWRWRLTGQAPPGRAQVGTRT